MQHDLTDDSEAECDELDAICSNKPLPRKLKRKRSRGPVTRGEQREVINQRYEAKAKMERIYALFGKLVKAVQDEQEDFPDAVFQDVHDLVLTPLANKLVSQ